MGSDNETGWPRGIIFLWIVFFASLAATIGLAGWLDTIDFELAQARGDGILSLELAWQPDSAQEILRGWGDDLVPVAQRSIRWDFLLIGAYVIMLSSLVALAWKPLARSGGDVMWLMVIAAALPVLAGASDVAENLLMLSMLADDRGVGTLRPMLTAGFAYTKFALLGLFIAVAAYFARTAARTIFRVRFSLLMLAIGIVVLFVPQWQEMMRAIAESGADGGLNTTQLVRAGWLAFASLLAAFSTWYCARVLFMFRFDGYQTQVEDPMANLKRWLPRALGSLIPALVALGYFVSVPADDFGDLVVPVAFQLAAFVLFLGVVVFRRKLVQIPPEQPLINVADRWSDLHRYTKYPLVGLAVANIIFFVLFLYQPTYAVHIGGAAVVLLAVALMVPVGSLLVFYSTRIRYPFLVVLAVLAVIFSLLNDNHSVRLCSGMDSTERTCLDDEGEPLPVERDGPFGPIADFDAFMDQWVDTRSDGESGIPVFIVAAEGGGIRAAYWTAHVLATLQDSARAEGLDFARNLLAISGVSGGSLGGGVFAASVKHLGNDCDDADCYATLAHEVLGEDFLSPTVATLLFPDLLQRLLPPPLFDDRAITLEQTWERAWTDFTGRDDFMQPFDALWADMSVPGAAQPPLLLLNSTVVETGQRLIMSPLQLEPDGIEFGEVFRDAMDGRSLLGNRVPLSTAVHLSARFTYVSPAGKVFHAGEDGQESGWYRLVDGGYFENSGAVTATELLDVVMRYARRNDVDLRPFVIHISNEPVIPDSERARAQLSFHPIMGEVLSPLRALMNVRPARGFQAREFLQRRLDEERDFVSHVHFLPCKRDLDLPLGWALSQAVQDELAAQLDIGDPHGAGAPAYNLTNLQQVLQHLRTGAVDGEPSARREAELVSRCRQG